MVQAVVVAFTHVLPFLVPSGADLSVRILGTKAARFRSSMHLDSVSNLPLLFPGASWTREAFLHLRRELGDVDLIARALGLFDEERLLVSAPRGDSVLCGEEILLNAAMVGLELILHV